MIAIVHIAIIFTGWQSRQSKIIRPQQILPASPSLQQLLHLPISGDTVLHVNWNACPWFWSALPWILHQDVQSAVVNETVFPSEPFSLVHILWLPYAVPLLLPEWLAFVSGTIFPCKSYVSVRKRHRLYWKAKTTWEAWVFKTTESFCEDW